MPYSYFQYLFFNLLFILLAYLTGHFVFNSIRVNTKRIYGNVFLKLCTGLFTLIGIYSYFKTGFSTIQSGFIIIALFLWWLRGAKKIGFQTPVFKKVLTDELKIILQLFLVLLLIYSWNYYYVYGTGRGIAENPHSDLNFFSNIATFFNVAGKESFEMNYLDLNSVGNTPYHYFEIWLTAFASFLFQIPSTLIVIQFISISFMLTLIVSGIWAIMEIFKINIYYKLYSLFILLISALFFPIYENINLYWSVFIQANLLDQAIGLKTSVIFCGLLIFIYLVLRDKISEALICLYFFSFASVYTFVNFIPEGILLASLFLYQKKINFRQWKIIVLAGISAAMYYQLFYKLTAGDFYSNVVGIDTVIKDLIVPSLKTRIIVSIQKILEITIVYAPFILISFLLFKKTDFLSQEKKKITHTVVFCLLIIYCCSLLSWQFFFKVFGATEFYQGVSSPLIHISAFFTIYFILLKYNNFLRIFTICYLLLITFVLIQKSIDKNRLFTKAFGTHYDVEYIKSIEAAELKNTQGVSLFSTEELTHNDNLVHSYYYHAGLYLNYLKPVYQINSLSIIDLPGGDEELEKHTKNTFLSGSMFYKFYKKQKTENKFVSSTQCKLDFIKAYNISYIIVSNKAKPDDVFKSIVKKEIIDKNSGERFWIVN